MKRAAALVLAAALTFALVLPAAAADGAAQDVRLAQVTQTVKDKLDLDTSAYTTFNGTCSDQIWGSQWTLHWWGDDGSFLYIDALEDGTVTWYSLHDPSMEEAQTAGLPSYPEGEEETARQSAQAFLDKALSPGLESVQLEEPQSAQQLGQSIYRFSGTILYHSLPTPLNYAIEVEGKSGQVTYFYRDVPYGMFLGEVPSPTPAISQEEAAQSLKESLSLKLEYVLPEDGGSQAVLRYVPDGWDEYYVDAQTGALVNLTELEESLGDMGMGGGASSGDSAAGSQENGLSQAEQEGIQKLEGVLSKETLDSQLRAVAQYGLEGCTLSSAAYRLAETEEGQEEQVLCTLRYLLPGEEGTASRTFTVDAKTGQVENLFSFLPWDEEQEPALTPEQAQQTAEAFLQSFCPERFDALALYSGPEEEEEEVRTQYFFLFARQENGYLFPEQFYAVGISALDGSVCRLSYAYDEDVTFDSPEGIVSLQTALDAWRNTYTVTLGYILVPEMLTENDPEAAPYLQLGLRTFYELKLGYGLEREGSYSGVDAKTGLPVQRERSSSSQLTYTDLTGHWAREAIETLAQYNVGYDGGTFAPGQAMTQWDMVALLFSVQAYPLDPAAATQEERDEAYAAAYQIGALTPGERQDDAPLPRSQAVKLLLNAEGLGRAAQLTGIYTCSYTDKSAISSEDLGYAALAQGIGMVQGSWAGDRTATRAEGAVMLHKLLSW